MSKAGHNHYAATDAQLKLIEIWASEYGLGMARGYLESQEHIAMEDATAVAHTYTADPANDATREMVMGKAEYWALQNAKTYWVSRRMMQTIEMTFNDLPDEALHPKDIPTESGFVYFERPHYVIDRHGKNLNIRAICWRPQYTDMRLDENTTAMIQSMGVTYYSDTRDENDEGWGSERFSTPEKRYEAGVPKLVLLATTSLPWRTTVKGDVDVDTTDFKMTMAAKVGTIGEPFDFSDGSFPLFPINDPDARLEVSWDGIGAKFLVALWRFSTQKIVRIGHHRISRPLQKRLERSKHQPDWGDVRTIDLRRVEYLGEDRDPSDMDDEAWTRWSHRWRVNPHWRRQWYPSEQRHKWILIDSYVKGPEHLPLIEKDDIMRVVR